MEIDRAILDTIRGRSEPILVIEAPPRHGKSELVSKYLPAWYLGTFPDRQVMLAGYEANFARSWGRRARELLDEWGPALFSVTVRDDVRAANDWGLEGRAGGMLTAGAGGPMTGRGAHLLIIDDPIKNAEDAQSETIRDKLWDWWQSTASTRIEPNGCAIIIATRWHTDDLSGRLIANSQTPDGQPIRRLHLPAFAEADDVLGRTAGDPLWPERWPPEKLDRQRKSLEDPWWNALYQQNPGLGSLAHWPPEYFPETLFAEAWPDAFEKRVVGCDPATGDRLGDYSAAVFLGRIDERYWVDSILERSPPELFVARALDLVSRHDAKILMVEKNLYGTLLQKEFQMQIDARGIEGVVVHHATNVTPKSHRIARLGPYLRNGQFRFKSTEANRLLVRQLREFPAGRHDDGPDALEFALRIFVTPATPPVCHHESRQ
jgi:predicted phage terminase large subunit-like protein